jgi:hypothetical protein
MYDFLRSLVRERAGELLGESACFTISLRPRSALRSGLGSADGSLLLLEKGKYLDDRRELLVGLSCGMCTASGSGASSDEGLDPPELPDVRPPFRLLCRSSSEMVPFNSTTGGWSKSFKLGM